VSRIIDVHTHYLAIGRFPEVLGAAGLTPDVRPDGTLRTTIEGVSSLVYPEFLQAERLDTGATQAGVDVRLVSATMQLNQLMAVLDLPAAEIARRINDEGAELMRRFPERTVAMASVCPFEPDHLAELDRAYDELGMRGVMIDTSWYVDGGWAPVFLDDPRTEPFWAHVERRDIPVFLHPPLLPYGFASMTKYRLEEAVGRPADTALSVARLILSGTFDRHPRLKVVLAHIGGALLAAIGRLDFTYRLGYQGLPDGQAAVCERRPSEYLRRNLYVDTMGFWAPQVREAIEVFGADRVLLGSDYGPVPISPAEHIDLVRSLHLDAADEDRVLGGNAEHIFQLS
jgi:aminocarboxymuconate-semialdehyde decarboxylase